ncbi:MAG: homoserine kinase [Pseudomonadota bacterium]
MAVYTDISEDELRAFIADYDVGDVLSYRGIAEGVENSNFLVHTTTANFILTLYEKRVDPNDLPFFLGLMQHLATSGVSCPLPVKKRDGEVLGRLAGRPAAIITFLEGIWPRKPDVSHCEAVGAGIAQMHLAGDAFELSRANSLSARDWQPLWASCAAEADSVQLGLGQEIAEQLATIVAGWPSGLPSGVIHADLFPDNVFFLGDKLSGIIDFYFACNDALAYDVAICLNAWCFERDGSFNLTKGAALLRGYQSIRPLDKSEKAALPMLARGAALRFFLTRLYDWVNTPDGAQVVKKDPMEYVRKLRFHARVEHAREYGLAI